MTVSDCAREDLKRLSISHGAKRVRYETCTDLVEVKIPPRTKETGFMTVSDCAGEDCISLEIAKTTEDENIDSVI